ncbi:MAG: hypothetical protein Q4C01_07320 [Clostridia bacterium]|nr:hypothetical protein [Clostridia bacterium]
MRRRAIILLACSILLIIIALYCLCDRSMSLQKIVSLLPLSLSEEDVTLVEAQKSNEGTELVLSVTYKQINERPNTFNVESYRNTKLYNSLLAVVEKNGLNFNDVVIQLSYANYRNKYGFISSLPIYLIIEDADDENKLMLIYVSLPERIKLT